MFQTGRLTFAAGECAGSHAQTHMGVRYYRFNRSGYTVRELATICLGLRKLLLPFYIVRLWFWKYLRRAMPVGDPIADTHLVVGLSQSETEDVRRRYEFLER